MKRFLCILLSTAVLLAASHITSAQDTPKPRPFNDGPQDLEKEMQKNVEKEARQKNYTELKDAAAQLAKISKDLSDDVEKGGEHVISARIFDRLTMIEKLSKEVREKAKGY